MVGAAAAVALSTAPTDSEFRRYQTGLEAVPGTSPLGENAPQNSKFDLYSEQPSGSTSMNSGPALQHVSMFRI
ncbi:homogentisate 1,2-dioxygenase [Colletotrichum tamarilloi]|uniref:Homogentisate 1,2-dioxygenase n=1 Tax=Colletotrichum tamarilloi TaxID=1209934 RepID=A0ABQ9R0U9_9PEZI|nr:homogentisate 1,2-dioxygenase [Colletotrichum tamarilloi]KAK1491509.1 homogentisate 1,2-dioxygenase [Colletotrichum tamarilloi]